MGVRTSVRGKFNKIVDSRENQEPEAKDSAKTLIADDRNNSDERAQSVRASPINRPDSSNAIICSLITKVFGRSWVAGIEKALESLDTIGSSMSDLSLSSDFSTEAAMKGNKISILAFEVAKTILKGSRLMQSLSDENISFLKTTVLSSKGVQTLISEDNDELMRIAAADKREEFESFLREVIRFGNRCKDPQWRNLDRYFEKLGWEFTPRKQSAKHLKAESAMQQLMTLVQYTALLSSELCAMDKVDKVYSKCCQEENISSIVRRGDFANLQADIKNRRKLVKALKKKSLWSRSFEEVVEKLVDIVNFVLWKMNEAFGTADGYKPVEGSDSNKKKLGPAGIALHYATIITQIDTLGTLSGSAPLSMREALYQRLPRSITSALPMKLRSFQVDQECHLIKAEMEKTLQWLSPIARNTIKALPGFAQNGGLANFSSEVSREVSGQTDVMRIETLYHADKEKTEACIFELLVWLHCLISQARNGGVASSSNPPNHRSRSSMLSVKDKEMLANVGGNVFKTGVSRSQNFAASKTKMSKINRLTKSSREYPMSGATKKDPLVRWPSCDPVIDFDICWIKTLDVIDGLESI